MSYVNSFNVMQSSILLFLLTFLKISMSQDIIPGGVLSEVWHFITNGTKQHFFGCKNLENFNDSDIQYYLYNRENRSPIMLAKEGLCELDSSKDIKIIFDGWLDSVKDELIMNMVHAYLDRYDCNIITIEYITLSYTEYTQAYCNIIKAAEIIGDFLCGLYLDDSLNFDRVHIVGHSLGAHLAGLVGQAVQKQCNQKVDRITGLDPAGPIYQNQANSARLDKSDATFVDVIHTNMGLLGYYGSMGHMDFFPNCGSVQPGCIDIKKFPDVKTIISDLINCSHNRSVELFTESIGTIDPRFNSTSCSLCPNSEGIGKCQIADVILFKPQYALMGEDCPRNSTTHKFLLKTNSKAIFYYVDVITERTDL